MNHSKDKENLKKNFKKNNIEKDTVKIKKKPRILMKTIITILLALIIFSFAFIGYRINQNGGGLSGILATVLGENTQEDLEPIQFILMGVSGVDNYKLSDTIMIVSYNPKTQKASLLSIPRDTYVGKKDKTASQNYLASYKINTIYRNGTNIPEALERISSLTGLDLSNYMIIDTTALIKIVDAIGGVTFDVPVNMDYDDDTQNLHIHLTAGEQLIDGAKAEQLLRFRHNNDGTTYPTSYGQQDLGRMKTQRAFVTETLKQTLKPQNLFKIKELMDIMGENVTTNMEVSMLKKYVPYAVNFNADDLQTGVLPGTVQMWNGVSLYIASKTESYELVKTLFGTDGTNSMAEDSINTNTISNTVITNNTTTKKTNSTKNNTSTK